MCRGWDKYRKGGSRYYLHMVLVSTCAWTKCVARWCIRTPEDDTPPPLHSTRRAHKIMWKVCGGKWWPHHTPPPTPSHIRWSIGCPSCSQPNKGFVFMCKQTFQFLKVNTKKWCWGTLHTNLKKQHVYYCNFLKKVSWIFVFSYPFERLWPILLEHFC